MSISKKYRCSFRENGIYHIYNRSNNFETLFPSDLHRNCFLPKYQEKMSPYLETFCWNLLNDHFHILVKVKPAQQIIAHLLSLPPNSLTPSDQKFLLNEILLSQFLETKFQGLFQSYAQTANNLLFRKGNLFNKSFKRTEILTNQQFKETIVFIHTNSDRHNLTNDFKKWKWSSWHKIYSKLNDPIKLTSPVNAFGNKTKFLSQHNKALNTCYIGDIFLDH